jgi:SAM-dependent methyltransferase
MKLLTDAFRVYAFAPVCQIRLLCAGFFVEALKMFVSPIGYWRFLPNAFVWQEFAKFENPTVLDASSPKMLSLMLGAHTRGKIFATDLNDEKIFTRWQRLARALKFENYIVEYQDARCLSYADETFDLVYSISVIEHIPERGDADALAEFARVLKPNGVIIVEVPYRREREEIYLDIDSKGTELAREAFYERRYDRAMIDERLTNDDLQIEQRFILGESLPIDHWIATKRLPRSSSIAKSPRRPPS